MTAPESLKVGDRVEVTVGPVAHGGHCVARHDGQVIFVRHSLPGERVVVEVTEVGSGSRFVRADAVDVLESAPGRVQSRCEVSGPGGCGGCDWQHASLDTQRRLKADVVEEQLRRLAGLNCEVNVESIAGDHSGLQWRTRVTYSVDGEGYVGLHRHRSNTVQRVGRCPLATELVASLPITDRLWPGVDSITAVASSEGNRALVIRPLPQRGSRLVDAVPSDIAIVGSRGSTRVEEQGGGRLWRVSVDGFWQVHPGAPDTLVAAVREGLAPRPGDHVVDLYAGVGLFGGSLAAELGLGGRVDCVESDAGACSSARRSLHDVPTVRVHEADVRTWLTRSSPKRCDLVVLDPPRAGAGKAVLERVLRMHPRRISYVACDPAALARDTAMLVSSGWRLDSLRAFDLFPMTHHVECVATFTPQE